MSEWPTRPDIDPRPPERPARPPFGASWPSPPGSPWPPVPPLAEPSVTLGRTVGRDVVGRSGPSGPSGPPEQWPEPPRPEPRRRKLVAPIVAAVAAVALVGGGVLAGVQLADDEPSASPPDTTVSAPEQDQTTAPGQQTDPEEAPAAPTPLPVQPGPVSEDVDEPVAAVAAAVAPAVVRIDTGSGTGSGILYDESGLLVTNAHVVGQATDVSVQLSDGTRTDGTVVGVDPAVDVAVVQIDGSLDFEVAVFAPSSTVEVGQLAVAIGSPFGLEQSVTAGIISAVNRAVPSTNVFDGTPTAVEMMQTDAPINPGNSGGALADRQGRVVGMNTSIRTDGTTQGNLGVGFAIPSDTMLLVAGRIVDGESLESGFLGVSGQDPASGRPGALVTEVVAGGPAEAGGLEPGDLIVAMDGRRVSGMSELAARVRLSPPGTVVRLDVIRDGAETEVEVTLGTLGQS